MVQLLKQSSSERVFKSVGRFLVASVLVHLVMKHRMDELHNENASVMSQDSSHFFLTLNTMRQQNLSAQSVKRGQTNVSSVL